MEKTSSRVAPTYKRGSIGKEYLPLLGVLVGLMFAAGYLLHNLF